MYDATVRTDLPFIQGVLARYAYIHNKYTFHRPLYDSELSNGYGIPNSQGHQRLVCHSFLASQLRSALFLLAPRIRGKSFDNNVANVGSCSILISRFSEYLLKLRTAITSEDYV